MKPSSRPPRTPSRLSDLVRRQLNMYALAASAFAKYPFTSSRAIPACLFPILIACALLMTGLAQAQEYKVLYSFTGATNDGADPTAIVREASGNIYGVTCNGGDSYYGTAFRLSPEDGETILYTFDAGYGACPGSLLEWHDNFYGATANGGDHGAGAVFKLDKKGHETVLYSFSGPRGALFPALSLVDDKGVFYGTTFSGGAYERGMIFKLDSTGKFAVLYSFTNGTDGSAPTPGLALDDKGNIYGTTGYGGDPNCTYPYGECGTVFRVDKTGHITTLHLFEGGTDGAQPAAGVIRDSLGNLYGTTQAGGDASCVPPYGCGTVFMVNSSGNENVLHAFSGSPDGELPVAGVVQDDAGNLYGTTQLGGKSGCGFWRAGCGIVFELDTTGKESVLYDFLSDPDGAFPAGLIRTSVGTLYGTTLAGGDESCSLYGWLTGCGTVFKLTP
jgi:uncharacterized repeat protein (TIGR03803 family)